MKSSSREVKKSFSKKVLLDSDIALIRAKRRAESSLAYGAARFSGRRFEESTSFLRTQTRIGGEGTVDRSASEVTIGKRTEPPASHFQRTPGSRNVTSIVRTRHTHTCGHQVRLKTAQDTSVLPPSSPTLLARNNAW